MQEQLLHMRMSCKCYAEQRLAAGKLTIPTSLHEGLRALAEKRPGSKGSADQQNTASAVPQISSITPEATSISSTSPTVTSIADVPEPAQMSAVQTEHAEHAEPSTSNSDAMPAEITGQQQQAFEEDVQVCCNTWLPSDYTWRTCRV